MSDPVAAAKSAREALSRALNAIQSDPSVPPHIRIDSRPRAHSSHAMGALFQVNVRASCGRSGPVALDAVRKALAQLQQQRSQHPTVAIAVEAVAGSLGLVHSIANPPAPAAQPPKPQAQAPVQSPQALRSDACRAGARAPRPRSGGGTGTAPAAAAPQHGVRPAPQDPRAFRPIGGEGASTPSSARTALRTSTRGSRATTSSSTAGFSSRPTTSRASANRSRCTCRCPAATSSTRWPSSGGRARRSILRHGQAAQPGFGAQFTQITPEARQLVYRYVRNREPLFHDDL